MKDEGFSLKGGSNTLLIVLAVVAAFLAAFNAFVALQQVSDLARLTGYQVYGANVSSGNVTLRIPMNIQVEFNPAVINWSNGTVISTFSYANLTTSETQAVRVIQGVWDDGGATSSCTQGRCTGLALKNTGNINVSVMLNASKNASDFFVWNNPPNQGYYWNVSANNTATPGSVCAPVAQCANCWGRFVDVNATNGTIVCKNLSWTPGINVLRIDIRLKVPIDVPRRAAAYDDTITAVAEASVDKP